MTETGNQFSGTHAASKGQVSIRYLLLWVGLACGFCLPASSYGWGAVGHRFITEVAVEELPAPLRTYFENYKTWIKNIAATEPPGNHFIDIDYYPSFSLTRFPAI
jgi:hypothetical protein